MKAHLPPNFNSGVHNPKTNGASVGFNQSRIRSAVLVIWLCAFVCLLGGCRFIALPGHEPFGERHYPEQDAERAYEQVRKVCKHLSFSDWNAYIIEIDTGLDRYDICDTEEYRAAWHEGKQDFLLYEDILWCRSQDHVTYRDVPWEELDMRSVALKEWNFVQQLLQTEPETITLKEIPLSAGKPMLLSVEFPDIRFDGHVRRHPRLSFALEEDADVEGSTAHWQEEGVAVGITYSPFAGSTSLLAERRIWSFAHDIGLLEDGVPAIGTQMENRAESHAAISAIPFDRLKEIADHSDALHFPKLPALQE